MEHNNHPSFQGLGNRVAGQSGDFIYIQIAKSLHNDDAFTP